MRILIDGQTFESPEIDRGIGVYTKNVINRMINQSYEHEWYIAVSNTRNLKKLNPWAQSQLRVIVSDEFNPGSDYERNRAYTDRLQEIIDEHNIDALWIPNPLMVNVLFLAEAVSCPTFVTIYDIIPHIFPIKEWPEPITSEYQRRLGMIKAEKNINLVMISEATRKDWVENLNDTRSNMAVTLLSADPRLFYAPRTKKTSDEPYILFTGGFDYRKNIDGAIESFALARKKHAKDADFLKYRLVIVGKYDQPTKEKYEDFIDGKGLTGHVELTGFVSDARLAQLYQEADIFFFPSKYEGFGLPLLEAMLAGDFVVSADNSSLPEVCGGLAELFNADKMDQMAEALYRGYTKHKAETTADMRRRQDYALGFSWSKTARETLEMIERCAMPGIEDGKRPSLALFSPWPNQKTGIANYVVKLTPFLKKYFDITIFTTAEGKEIQKLDGVPVRNIQDFAKSQKKFDYKLYQIGNNEAFHKEIFNILEEEGGIAEVHDFILTAFFYISYFKKGEQEHFRELLEAGYGADAGSDFYEQTLKLGNHPDIFDCPMAHSVVAKAQKTIFHNHWCTDQIGDESVYTVPHPSFPMPLPDRDVMEGSRKKLQRLIKKGNKDVVVGCFGWVNNNKRPRIVIQAVQKLVEKGYNVKLAFWGENGIEDLPDFIRECGLENRAFISEYLTWNEYYAALEMSDIVVNLRYPSMGEASGTLCEAFQAGKPVIVSEMNQYREYPD